LGWITEEEAFKLGSCFGGGMRKEANDKWMIFNTRD